MLHRIATRSALGTEELGIKLGGLLRGGEIIELISDLGGGKTTLVRGLAKGMKSQDIVQSPTFTISLIYRCADNKELHHYDFYRLGNDAGIVGEQLAESVHDDQVVTVVEWGEGVNNQLKDAIKIAIAKTADEDEREISVTIPEGFHYLAEAIKGLQS